MTELIKFVEDDPAVILAEIVKDYETETGKKLYPAQVENLLLGLMAYRESLTRSAINDAARQNLLAFARAPMIDYLGELVGVARLPAQFAQSTVRITFENPLQAAIVIPESTVFSADMEAEFVSIEDVLASAGALYVDIPVIAVLPGPSLNGLPPGRINEIADPLAVAVASIANTDTTSGGAEIETDDQLRERIRLAPEAFSVAGSKLAYQFHARSAHPDIVAVAVLSPSPCVVCLYPLAKTGIPSAKIQNSVLEGCSAEKVRPLTDFVQVLPPQEIPYKIRAELTLYALAGADLVIERARAELNKLVNKAQVILGHDIEPSQMIAALRVPGVKRVRIITPNIIEVPENAWANCVEIELIFAGVGDD
jgi:phage-related baseplate assembly protein